MNITRTAHEWSKHSFFSKAQRYAEKMLEKNHSDWEFGFWSALTLEILVRASISNISPTLVADGKDWNNILYALDKTPNQKKFIAKSADISDLLRRAESLFPDFTTEMLSFSLIHINKRNSELHSGSLPFDDVSSSSWMPMFYWVCKVLLESSGETLSTLFGTETAAEAEIHIEALRDASAKSVKGTIHAHTVIWNEKTEEEKEQLIAQAELLSNKHRGHRVQCPACNSVALLQGSSIGVPRNEIVDDGIVEKQSMLPSSFECTACGLKILGYSKLVACELGNTYTATNHYLPMDYFGIDIEEEMRAAMFEDNNEPF